MKNIFVVQPSEVEIARRMEKRLVMLPEESGILFVGVEVHPSPDGVPNPTFKIFIGCRRDFEASLMVAIAKQYLRDEVADESQLVVEARRGVDKSEFTS
jgi:hypothetical protein